MRPGSRPPTKYALHYLKVVGEEGFEPPTLWSQTRCATKLRYSPTYDKFYELMFVLSSTELCDQMHPRAEVAYHTQASRNLKP